MTIEQLSSLILEGEKGNSAPYWHRFGFAVAGPLCYAYARWVSECLDREYPDVTDVVFVARDGYLLKKLYDMLPHDRETKTHYVYAPRAIGLSCENSEKYARYRAYLESKHLGSGAIAVVDTVTIRFSAQKLLAASIDRPVYGFYWIVLYEAIKKEVSPRFEAFQKERYHTIDTWNIMEFIMSAPEPPVQDIVQGQPVYYQENEFETLRIKNFKEMSTGVLKFAQCMIQQTPAFPNISNDVAVRWINHFLRNPTPEDIEEFRCVMFSVRPDHSDCTPLNPFQASKQPAILRRLIRMASCVLKPQLIRLYQSMGRSKPTTR